MDDVKTITVSGGCHCGAIRYSCKPALDRETGRVNATRCNCTFCQKLGGFTSILLNARLAESFTLLSPSSRDELGDYLLGRTAVHRYFCKKCAVHVWREGSYGFNGMSFRLLAVNLSTVDQPQDGIDLKNVKIRYFDGLHDNYPGGLADEPWSGGSV